MLFGFVSSKSNQGGTAAEKADRLCLPKVRPQKDAFIPIMLEMGRGTPQEGNDRDGEYVEEEESDRKARYCGHYASDLKDGG